MSQDLPNIFVCLWTIFFKFFLETAINVGYYCQLLTDDMVDMFIVDGQNDEDVEIQLVNCEVLLLVL